MDAALPIEIDVFQVRELLDAEADFLFLDCREPDEYAHCRIETARLVPMRQLPAQLGSLDEHRDRRIVVLCHHGQRSLHAARWLRENGFPQSQSMAGGIDAWSTEIDSRVPRY